jgi:nucleoid DNA-binding protein
MATTKDTLANYLKFFISTDYRVVNKLLDKTSLYRFVQIVFDTLNDELVSGNAVKIKNFGLIGVFKNKLKIVRNPRKPKELHHQKQLLTVRVAFSSATKYAPAYEMVIAYTEFCKNVHVQFENFLKGKSKITRYCIDDVRLLMAELFTRLQKDRQVQIRDFACFNRMSSHRHVVNPTNGVVIDKRIVYRHGQRFSSKLIARIHASPAYENHILAQRLLFGLQN